MIARVGAPPPSPTSPTSSPTANRPSPTTARFRDHLSSSAPSEPSPRPPADASPVAERLRGALVDIDHQREGIDHLIAQAQRGQAFSPAELIALQARVYTYSQNMEVLSRLTDRAAATLKTILNTTV